MATSVLAVSRERPGVQRLLSAFALIDHPTDVLVSKFTKNSAASKTGSS